MSVMPARHFTRDLLRRGSKKRGVTVTVNTANQFGHPFTKSSTIFLSLPGPALLCRVYCVVLDVYMLMPHGHAIECDRSGSFTHYGVMGVSVACFCLLFHVCLVKLTS